MTESEILKEVIVMLLDHIRSDGQVAYFSFSEVRWLEDMKKKLTNGGGEDEKRKESQHH